MTMLMVNTTRDTKGRGMSKGGLNVSGLGKRGNPVGLEAHRVVTEHRDLML